jgi:hypothetical protein
VKIVRTPGAAINVFKDSNLDSKIAKVGWFESDIYPDEIEEKTNKVLQKGLPVATVAHKQEFGDPEERIPPRPFMSTTIDQQRNNWLKKLKSGARAILAGNETPGSVMEAMGALAAGQIRKTITLIKSPKLSKRTIYDRLHRKSNKKTIGALDKPLVDTGIMLNTLTHQVEDKK